MDLLVPSETERLHMKLEILRIFHYQRWNRFGLFLFVVLKKYWFFYLLDAAVLVVEEEQYVGSFNYHTIFMLT